MVFVRVGNLGMLPLLQALVFIAEVVAVNWHEVFRWHQREIHPFRLSSSAIPRHQVA